MLFAGCHDRFRLAFDDMVHDGQVVRRKIPNDADVVLEQPQIDAQRIVVIEIAQRAALGQFANLSDRAGEQERVVHHDRQLLARRQLNQLLRLRRTGGKWLLDEHVLAVFQRLFSQFVVGPNGRDHRDRIDRRAT